MKKLARIAIPLILLICLCACRQIQYIPVKTIKVDTTYISKIKIDSIYQKDSIYIESIGDTVFVNKYAYKYKYLEKHDTLWRERVDTIQTVRIIEAPLSIWQKTKMNLGLCFIGALVVIAGIIAIKKFIR